MIIAVDGPTASGKNTTCALLGEKLGIAYINSGSYYRAVTYSILAIPVEDREEYLASNFPLITLQQINNVVHFFLNGKDITKHLQDNEVSTSVAHIASIGFVRHHATQAMQAFAHGKDVISDGRDATTVIFPHADFKIYLDAPLHIRATRRHQDIIKQGKSLSLEEVEKEIAARDSNDLKTSGFDPKLIPGMHIVDSSTGGPKEIVEHIYTMITSHA